MMRVNNITTTVVALVLSAFATSSYADNTSNNANHNWMPKQPGNAYWQTPNWSGSNMPPAYNPSQPAQHYNNYRPPAAPAYRQAPPPNYPAQNANRATPPQGPNSYRGYNQQQRPNSYNGYRPPSNPNAYRGNTPPPPRGPYNNSNYVPDNGASAYNIPGYNRYRNNNGMGNMWGNNNNNNFWGNSGPGTWMNPNKDNMEQGWDDMINAPSRMGEMPGGWNAPEVSMPNPVDVGDQFQDNVKDLPEQIRNMDVGNN
ncbi:MAG: hypothetical protein IZT55_05695 [Anaerolineae bacterium]|nr:hypothetical protein [Anaerolineae bacterium]